MPAMLELPDNFDDLSRDNPYLELGRRIGRLLEESQGVADDVRASAQSEAHSLLHDARRISADAEAEAERILLRARKEANLLLETARAQAAQLSQKIATQRHAAVAEITVLRREALRDAEGIRKEAHQRADEIVAAATGRVGDRVRQLERRIMQLQLTESELEARIDRLKSQSQTEE